jgi:3-phenylpropionate/cinnamic acid dioxygenase small subunit
MTTDTKELMDRGEVAELLFNFAACFDEKKWDAMRDCLDDAIYCDYSSLRGVAPGLVAREEYVAQRIATLNTLVMQHDLTNLRVRIDGEAASVRCNFVIRRFRSSSESADFFHSYGRYLFKLVRRDTGWRISGVTQVVTRNRGNPKIHGGTATATKSSPGGKSY